MYQKLKLLAFSCVFIFLSGCESMPFSKDFGSWLNQPANDEETGQVTVVEAQKRQQSLSDQLVFFLESAKPGDIGMIDKSPWSTNHEIMAKDFYYSATGKKCREIRLLHSVEGLPHEQHLCLDSEEEWVPIRCISR